MIFVVLTVFGVCGIGVLALLRTQSTKDDDDKVCSLLFSPSFDFVPFLPQNKETMAMLTKSFSPSRKTK